MPVFDFSDILKKKEESQCTYMIHCSGEAVASPEKPMLALDNNSRDWKHRFRGILTNQAKRTVFKFKEEDGTISADILWVDARFTSLLCWPGENRTSVRLPGQDRGDGYTVYKVQGMAFGGGTKLPAEDESLQFTVDRLLVNSAPGTGLAEEDLEGVGDGMKLTSLQGLFDFMNCAGRTLPDSIRTWICRNLVVVRPHEVIPEERRHTQRALSIMMDIQWKSHCLESIDPRKARRVLDEELYGMERVRQRIIKIIIQINRAHTLPTYGMLLVGPAGTEKSQIAYAAAKILRLLQTTLGMSSINGSEQPTSSPHIYSNAKPGIIMETFSMAGKSNLVFTINELDKASVGRGDGDPADVLLTLLGGLGFADSYIGCVIPTGGTYSIATANSKSQISVPLVSRFAVTDIPDYTPEEKKIISFRYAMLKVLRRVGPHENECVVTGETLDVTIRKYADITRIRGLEQATEHMVANALYQIEVEHVPAVAFDGNTVRGLLG